MSELRLLHQWPHHLKSMLNPRVHDGFTFIELMITLAILGVLASAAYPMAKLSVQRTKEQDLRVGLRSIRLAIDAYKQATDEGKIPRSATSSGYPPTLESLVDGVKNAKDPQNGKIYFLRRLPRDPFAETDLRPAQTWAKRSYKSPPEKPKEGDDVFDIYSKTDGKGLNTIPYRDW